MHRVVQLRRTTSQFFYGLGTKVALSLHSRSSIIGYWYGNSTIFCYCKTVCYNYLKVVTLLYLGVIEKATLVASFTKVPSIASCQWRHRKLSFLQNQIFLALILCYFSWTGAGQVCCYDFEGWLQHADDYENAAYVRFYSPGVGQRGHPLGSYPFKRPPYVPSMSNYYTDLMAYEMCCKWSGRCEFYYWRRPTSGCHDYRPPAAGFSFVCLLLT